MYCLYRVGVFDDERALLNRVFFYPYHNQYDNCSS